MNESKIETTTGMCVIALTKHIMKKKQLDYEAAYKVLLTTELYKLLQDSETRLFLETNEYLTFELSFNNSLTLPSAYSASVSFGDI